MSAAPKLDSFPSAAPEVVDRVAPAAHVFEPSTVDEAAAIHEKFTFLRVEGCV